MCEVLGTLSVYMFVRDGEREKKVRVCSWANVFYEDSASMLEEFLQANPHVKPRQCIGRWQADQRVLVPKELGL